MIEGSAPTSTGAPARAQAPKQVAADVACSHFFMLGQFQPPVVRQLRLARKASHDFGAWVLSVRLAGIVNRTVLSSICGVENN